MSEIQRTFSLKASQVEKKWYIVDAEGKVLGRLASGIAKILRGKHKPHFTPHMDAGDNIIVINAEKVLLTGNKGEDKEYFKHTEYPGGRRFINIKKYLKDKPEFIIEHAVKGMLPKNRLGRRVLKNLKIYSGNKHPHDAQKPEKIDI
jgi:large subunit ribosomal protein L13